MFCLLLLLDLSLSFVIPCYRPGCPPSQFAWEYGVSKGSPQQTRGVGQPASSLCSLSVRLLIFCQCLKNKVAFLHELTPFFPLLFLKFSSGRTSRNFFLSSQVTWCKMSFLCTLRAWIDREHPSSSSRLRGPVFPKCTQEFKKYGLCE